ncbi:hypothetical protein SLS53_002441 [Cytospora paraplurivora]|uniref:Uncharacterized protein n=1 Tax=Cytospora paraplurivora TaxID=2898453 RepID=A0AAN9UEZ8_9PEZI
MDFDLSMCDFSEMLPMFPGTDADAASRHDPQPPSPGTQYLKNGLDGNGYLDNTELSSGHELGVQIASIPTPMSLGLGHRSCPQGEMMGLGPRTPTQNIAAVSILPLIEIAHQLEVHIARQSQDLYVTLGIVRSALQELQVVTDRKPPHQQRQTGWMECVVANQISDLLGEACDLTVGPEATTSPQQRSRVASDGRGFGSGAFGLGTAAALNQVDENDRRAMQAVMVQRQVKRATAVVQRLRSQKKTLIAGGQHAVVDDIGNGSDESGSKGNIDELTLQQASPSVLGLADVEHRLDGLVETLKKYADIGLDC